MARNEKVFDWHDYIAATTAVIAVLAAITSLQAGSSAGSLLLEKNNSNYYQAKANKEWNSYLANDITNRVLKLPNNQLGQQKLQQQAESLEKQADDSTAKATAHFSRNGDLTTAGTFFEIAIAISAMGVLVKKKVVWFFSLLLSAVGIYFLILGVI